MGQEIRSRLRDIKTRIDSGEASPTPTVREFLSWVGAQRRGYYIVIELRDHLKKAGLRTIPDFESVHIDTPIAFATRAARQKQPAESELADGIGEPPAEPDTPPTPDNDVTFDDPRYRVSRLASANRSPTRISPNTPLQVAVTKMLTCDFSQLPVMTGDRDVKGVISWQSIAKGLATGKSGGEARNYMDPARVVSHDESLLTAMREVSIHAYVLVRGINGHIAGIVTTTDINEQFMQLTEPFLLLGEIEQALRSMLDRLPKQMLKQVCDPRDTDRVVHRAADLTFGEYLRLLEEPTVWAELHIPLDRGEFVAFLDQVRQTRNDVMHFDPDGIPETAVSQLRNLVRLLEWVCP